MASRKQVEVVINLIKDTRRNARLSEESDPHCSRRYPISTYSGEYKSNGNYVRFKEWSEEQLKAFHMANTPIRDGVKRVEWVRLEQIVDYGYRKIHNHAFENPGFFLNTLVKSNHLKEMRVPRVYRASSQPHDLGYDFEFTLGGN